MPLENNELFFSKAYSMPEHQKGNQIGNLMRRPRTEHVLIATVYETAPTPEGQAEISKNFSHESVIKEDTIISISEFQYRYGNLRQSLALRKLKGESLSNIQEILLSNLNAKLKTLMRSENDMTELDSLKKFIEEYG